MRYRSVIGEATAERTVERSRFLAYVSRTEGETAAKEFLAGVRRAHPLATHVCYGYVADREGNLMRFSDDGEPQGTAGLPILNTIRMQDLREVAVAVVRYFGGIKLGAGGLVRAYSAAAAEGLAAARIASFESCVEFSVRVGYSEVGAALRFLEGSGAETVSAEYGEGADFAVAVKESEADEFCANLCDALSGRVRIAERKRYIFPFG